MRISTAVSSCALDEDTLAGPPTSRSAPALRHAARPTGRYLGPARVVSATPARVRVDVRGAQVEARLALAFPYEPEIDDVLLVIGGGAEYVEAAEYYVIGVLSGSGRTVLRVPGDMEIRAGGSLAVAGEQGVHISGPEVAVETRTFRAVADALVQRASTLYQRVTSLLSIRAGEAETIVDGAQVTRSKSASYLTEGSMTLNGKQIHLG